jgi:hypothetical protein
MRAPLHLLALAAVVMGTLSGCFSLRMDLHLRSDNTVDGSIVLAFDEQAVQQAGGERDLIDALLDDKATQLAEPSRGDVEVREYRDGQRVGVEYGLSAVPISDFNTGVAGAEGAIREFSIQRVDDTFVVDGKVRVGAVLGVTRSVPTTQALTGADLSISLTFPGVVHESNGTVNGNTVTWSPPVGDAFVVHAVGDADDGSGSGLLIWLAVALSVLAVLVALAVIASRLLSRHRVGKG